MTHKLLALLICVLVQSPQWACTCAAHEHHDAGTRPEPHEHDDDCPASQPVPKWKAVKPPAPDLPAAAPAAPPLPCPVAPDLAAHRGDAPATPLPPGVPIYLAVRALRN